MPSHSLDRPPGRPDQFQKPLGAYCYKPASPPSEIVPSNSYTMVYHPLPITTFNEKQDVVGIRSPCWQVAPYEHARRDRLFIPSNRNSFDAVPFKIKRTYRIDDSLSVRGPEKSGNGSHGIRDFLCLTLSQEREPHIVASWSIAVSPGNPRHRLGSRGGNRRVRCR